MKKPASKSVMASFKTRAFRAGGYSIAATAIILAMLILLNLLVGRLPSKMTKYDLTSSKLNSITAGTKSILKQVDKDITIYWMSSESAADPYVESLLQLVKEQNKRIKVVQKDLNIYPEFATNYTDETVIPNSLIVECGDRFRYLNYSGDIYTYDNADYYTTYTYTTYFNGEGALVGAIKYVTGTVLPKVYYLTGHEELELAANYAAAVKNQNIELVELSLLKEETVPQDADAVVICAPQRDISADELKKLQDYTDAGGNLLVMTDYYFGKTITPNLETLMNGYGMASVPGLVMDGAGGYYYQYPYFLLPELTTHATTDPLITGKVQVLLFTAHGISIADEMPSNLTVTPLMNTSGKAYAKQKKDSDTMSKENGDLTGPFVLAAHSVKNEGEESESNVVWVGAPSLAESDIDELSLGGNMDLFLNILGYEAAPEEMEMTVHAKPLTEPKYLLMSKGTKTTIGVIVMALIPTVFLVVGAIFWYRRKRR